MKWDRPLQFFLKHGFTNNFVSEMYDGFSSLLFGRPCFDIYKFDDYLHWWKGSYEDDGKTLNDMFDDIFGADAITAKAYFGIFEYKKMEL